MAFSEDCCGGFEKNGRTCREASLSVIVKLPSSQHRPSLKGKNLFQRGRFLSFNVDPFEMASFYGKANRRSQKLSPSEKWQIMNQV